LRIGIKTDAAATSRYGAIEVDDNGVKRHLVMQPTSGNVGIGTIAPAYPLEVSGGVQTTLNTGRFFTTGIPNLTEMTPFSTQSPTIAIKANNAIWSTTGFYSSSDKRAKENIFSSTTNESLSIINQLNIVQYNWVDKAKTTKKYEEGLIAQEVEKIIPEAVTKIKEFIPNIYQLADSYELIIENEILVAISKVTDLIIGDKVKMFTESGKELYGCISEINNKQLKIITTESLEYNMGRIFLYGKEVADFHTVDYDRVFTVGIAAIQELSKQNDERKKEIQFLKIENEKLKSGLDRIRSLEAQVDYLKEIILFNTKK